MKPFYILFNLLFIIIMYLWVFEYPIGVTKLIGISMTLYFWRIWRKVYFIKDKTFIRFYLVDAPTTSWGICFIVLENETTCSYRALLGLSGDNSSKSIWLDLFFIRFNLHVLKDLIS